MKRQITFFWLGMARETRLRVRLALGSARPGRILVQSQWACMVLSSNAHSIEQDRCHPPQPDTSNDRKESDVINIMKESVALKTSHG